MPSGTGTSQCSRHGWNISVRFITGYCVLKRRTENRSDTVKKKWLGSQRQRIMLQIIITCQTESVCWRPAGVTIDSNESAVEKATRCIVDPILPPGKGMHAILQDFFGVIIFVEYSFTVPQNHADTRYSCIAVFAIIEFLLHFLPRFHLEDSCIRKYTYHRKK